MDSEFFLSHHFIALAVGLLIFLITVLLSAKQWIDFPLTVIFLLFAIAASMSIENYDLFRIMQTHSSSGSVSDTMEKIIRENREMRDEIEKQNKQLQQLIETSPPSEKEPLPVTS